MNTSSALHDVVDAFAAQLARGGHAADPVRIETHISLVLLAGTHAWKFKKPVDFGFVDFSTLERRRHFCEREVALNRRFAPTLYEAVEPVFVDGAQEPSEYAVRMQRFATDQTLDALVPRGAVSDDAIAALARRLAAAHAAAAVAPAASDFGAPALLRAQVEACIGAPLDALLPETLGNALAAALDRGLPLCAARRAAGRVRDCHGDLHLSNVVALDGALLPFDCIEFNDELRIVDTLSDAAFLLMDLDRYDACELGNVFVNTYLEAADDYAGLPLLPLFCAYRSLVRAKVALLGAAQADTAHGAAARARAAAHVALAQRYLAPAGRAGLVITHGVSGSGKSYRARQLARARGFVHLRSDVERQRIAGPDAGPQGSAARAARLYDAAHTAATYARLRALADVALGAGFSVVVDATFLDPAQRASFASLAQAHEAPFHILRCHAPVDELRRRVVARAAAGSDPSEATPAVLDRQIAAGRALNEVEMPACVDADDLDRPDAAEILSRCGRARI